MDENNNEQNVLIDHQMQRKANIYFFSKVAFNIFLCVLGALVIALFLRNMQTKSALIKQAENSRQALSEAIDILNENAESADSLAEVYHSSNQEVLDDIDRLFSTGLYGSLKEADSSVSSAVFQDVVSRSEASDLFMMTADGHIVFGSNESLYGSNPAVYGYMTQENVNQILRGSSDETGTVEPVLVKNRFGTYYYYSKPYTDGTASYMLVLGVDSSVLDEQIASLKDVSTVLSRTALVNDGFLFAVDQKDGLFLYYKNGDDLLSGQSASSAGLSEDALADGYSGTETIRGKSYYCVSQTYGDQTIVCAAARTDTILSTGQYIVLWSVLGFICIMLLCLSYTVIVRNDFVRKSVKTDRIVLRKDSDNPIYFDKSVFRKVIPLMMTGVLVMFGISFYTQTLLEISEGIEKSEVALQEVSGRYEESTESRETIENYYNTHFLAKARLIAFLIEEDPTILNAASDHYHSIYDEDGNKVYLTDDEGNRLKSVAYSSGLQELCDTNEIDAVYVFDQDGHTIATNTANWYFTLSRNEEDQSYAFQDVLSGKSDSYIQEAMVNDLGEETQFIGVTFHYYTSVNENGETVYVSRYDSMQADSSAQITAHSSMVQIALDADLSQRLLASTDIGNILSANMLQGGFIVMFDTTEDHRCLYSPNEASIGKTAAELGISANAFSGENYYGFNKVNGISYFQYFRYTDGYYIATALPVSGMYLTRLPIALITAAVCLVLILILSLTVTLTNKEEEHLYETMSEEQVEKGWNSAIFNIIMPSGRTASTVKAAARWDNRHLSWSQRSPEQKLMVMVTVIFGFLALYLILVAYGVNNSHNDSSIVKYILSGGWDRSLNIFALSACVIVLSATIILVNLLRIPVRLITSLLGTRGETIGHLLLSVTKYGGTIGVIFYCLYLIGIDSGSLITSAGILSLVIGLGAQSLIQDIIAGIFIVFEGEFRVGDIVTINDYRGTVMDIGLRTTKIMAPDGNIKIYSNSNISGVLNMTKETSVVTMTISIEYGQDIEYVEAVLKRDLPPLRDKNPAILDGPIYLGVSELGESGISLLIMARCSEKNTRGVSRFLNRELLQIFYHNDINVPFPNITISDCDESGRKTLRDFMESMAEQERNEHEEK